MTELSDEQLYELAGLYYLGDRRCRSWRVAERLARAQEREYLLELSEVPRFSRIAQRGRELRHSDPAAS